MTQNTHAPKKVRLELHASGLKNVAGAFKGTSDPYAVVTVLPAMPNDKPKILGKTEVIKNSLSPRWVTHFDIDYELGSVTRFNVGIFDEIRKAKTNKPMGSAMFEVGEILGARGNVKAKKLRTGGVVFARLSSPPVESAGVLRLSMRGVGLKNVDGLFSKSDPFVEISAQINAAGGATWQPVFRSKEVMNNQNPIWPTMSMDVNRLCGGDLNKPILVAVFDWEKSGKHKTMGSFETSVQSLMNAETANGTGPPKQVNLSKAFLLKKGNKKYGNVVVCQAKIDGATPSSGTTTNTARPVSVPTQPVFTPIPVPLPTPIPPPAADRPKFVDYLAGGCELNLSIAIDFTGSNGDPRRPGTLHHIRPDGQLNDYEKCLTSVGSIVGKYDSDQSFPVYGFGAKYGGIINHCFQIGGQPELSGLPAVLQAYRQVFRTGLTMSGPTDFSRVIDTAAAHARSSQAAKSRIGQQIYQILLILTDGAVSDINLTAQAVQRASDAPLSIVIVGVGTADFTKMTFLDDLQTSSGRDIVQFVEFGRYQNDKSALTRETLDEIPDQLVDYFHGRGIQPLPSPTESRLNIVADEPTDEDIDLSIEYNDEGEIDLSNYDGVTYDETKYDTAAAYTTPQPTARPLPSAPMAPVSVATPVAPQAPVAPPAPTAPPAAPHVPFSLALSHPAPPPQPVPSAPPAPAAVPANVFHVQVPPGMVAGQQLQVVNPYNQQHLIVTIPPGIPAGGVFGVQG